MNKQQIWYEKQIEQLKRELLRYRKQIKQIYGGYENENKIKNIDCQ